MGSLLEMPLPAEVENIDAFLEIARGTIKG